MSKPDSVVFVVDDDASVRDAIQSLIRSVGLHVGCNRRSKSRLELSGRRLWGDPAHRNDPELEVL